MLCKNLGGMQGILKTFFPVRPKKKKKSCVLGQSKIYVFGVYKADLISFPG